MLLAGFHIGENARREHSAQRRGAKFWDPALVAAGLGLRLSSVPLTVISSLSLSSHSEQKYKASNS